MFAPVLIMKISTDYDRTVLSHSQSLRAKICESWQKDDSPEIGEENPLAIFVFGKN